MLNQQCVGIDKERRKGCVCVYLFEFYTPIAYHMMTSYQKCSMIAHDMKNAA